jgi:hypothetical protein
MPRKSKITEKILYEAPRQTIEACPEPGCEQAVLTGVYKNGKYVSLDEPVTALQGRPHTHDKGMEVDF